MEVFYILALVLVEKKKHYCFKKKPKTQQIVTEDKSNI